MENIKNNTQENFTVSHKGKLWDEPFKFAYKLSFVIILSFFIAYGFINGLVGSYNLVNKLNSFIKEKNIKSINQILDQINELTKEEIAEIGWIMAIKDGDNYKYYISKLFHFIKDSERPLKAIFLPGEYIIYYFSYFTILSNILTIVWMMYALLKPSHEGKKGLLNLQGSTITAAYITITSIIFNTSLMPVIIMTTGTFLGNKPMPIIEQEVVHTIGPIAFVVYICVFVKYDNIELANNNKMYKTWGYAIIGLVSYGFYAVIRGVLKYLGGATVNDFFSWPYFFTQVLEKESLFFKLPGWLVFIIFIMIIAAIFIIFHTIYWKTITKWKNKKTR